MISLVLSSLLLLSPATAVPSIAPTPSSLSEEELALTIDGDPISVKDFTRWLVRFRGEALAIDFVEMWELEREAERLGLEVSEEEVAEAVEEIIARRVSETYAGDAAKWSEELINEHRTVLGYRLELELAIRGEKLSSAILKKERRITEETLREAWVHRYGRDGRTIDARVLEVEPDALAAPPAATLADIQKAREEALAAAKARIDAIRAEVVQSGDFSALARRYSSHDSARRGGSPVNGFIFGDWSSDITDALATVEAGELSPPILGMGSWWIFQVDSVKTTPFESVRDSLLQALLETPPTQQEHLALSERLLTEANWEVLPAMWTQPKGELLDDQPVLTIDGVPIQRSTFSDWLRVRNGEIIAGRFVESWVIEHKAQELGLEISNEEFHQRIDREIERLVRGSEAETLEEWLASKPGSPSLDAVVRDMLITHVAVFLAEDILKQSRSITEPIIRGRWIDSYGPDGMTRTVRMIRLQFAPRPLQRGATDEEIEQMKKLYEAKLEVAERIRERYDNGEDFGALARKYSDDENKILGGELSGGFRPSDWPYDVIEALDAIEVGQVSQPVIVESSLLLFELLDQRVTPLEDVHDKIAEELRNEAPSIPEIANQRNILVRDVPWTVEPHLVR